MANYHRRAFSKERDMKVRTIKLRQGLALAGWGLLSGAALPAWAVSLSTMGPAQPLPEMNQNAEFNAGTAAAGSATLIPVMAADVQARTINTVDAPASGAMPVGKPIDDIQFVKQATENGRKEVSAAQEALPQLKNPQLKQNADLLAKDHTSANERLSQFAEAKGWPGPAPTGAATAPPSGTASSDFDAKWTAEMIAGHERSIALYRAQAAGGEDKDLRKYAKETLPTIEKHLAQLRSLQK
jgi:putative membrane protein